MHLPVPSLCQRWPKYRAAALQMPLPWVDGVLYWRRTGGLPSSLSGLVICACLILQPVPVFSDPPGNRMFHVCPCCVKSYTGLISLRARPSVKETDFFMVAAVQERLCLPLMSFCLLVMCLLIWTEAVQRCHH